MIRESASIATRRKSSDLTGFGEVLEGIFC